VLLQAEVNNTDDDDDNEAVTDESAKLNIIDQDPKQTSTPTTTPKLYPTAPALDESDDSTASAHSTSV